MCQLVILADIQSIDVQYSGGVGKDDLHHLTDCLLVGPQKERFRPQNMTCYTMFVSLIDERGIKINEIISSATGDFTNLIFASINTDEGESSISGTVFKNNEPKIETYKRL